ncbi:tyrosine-type recombinase/integrase [Streptomyces sp. NPDC048254]|uniref:tyrosine-type recombinase/integrase n=1 Tax=Streptomyces sp. NPDC048254 TaxID=3365525 RepID=UPI003713F55C
MASIHPRTNKADEVTAWLVKWRLGGARTGPQQTERFDPTDEGLEAAKVFCGAVNEAGQQWPLGWVKGQGMIARDPDDESQYRFLNYATESIQHRTGVEDRYVDACMGELERYLAPAFGNCDIRSTEHFCKRTIQAWVNQLAATKVRRGSKTKLMSPKTIKNLHGLLSSILQEAVDAEPPLRDRNPCKGVRLPRTDDDGTSGDEVAEDIEFLEPVEVAGVVSCMRTARGKRLTEDLYATGARWGEASAWACRHLNRTDPDKPRVRITRAWKWSKSKGHYLGTPKSKRSRRSIRITDHTFGNWIDQGALTKEPDDLVYDNGKGERLPYSTFYDEWEDAKCKAKELALLPKHKNPTIHDLRHSHAAALISAGHSPTYVQRRLGHESIKTTSDLYGHLLVEADDAAMATIDATLDGLPITHVTLPAPVRAVRPFAAAAIPDHSTVHVVVFPDGHQEAFWKPDVARLVSEVWKLERRESVRIDVRSASLWAARYGGLDGVHDAMPARARVWRLGPVVYGPDGAEQAAEPGAHELRDRWFWEWEEGYTTEVAACSAEYRPAPASQTEAAAWGLDEKAVRAALVRARAKALRMCARHPSVAADAVVQES